MKVAIHIKYPYWQIHTEDKLIDVPDGIEPEDYIYENREKIIMDAGCELPIDSLDSAIDAGYADVVLLKNSKGE